MFVNGTLLAEPTSITTREQAEVWVFQFAAALWLDPVYFLAVVNRFATTGERTPESGKHELSGPDIDWEGFWRVYRLISGYDVTWCRAGVRDTPTWALSPFTSMPSGSWDSAIYTSYLITAPP